MALSMIEAAEPIANSSQEYGDRVHLGQHRDGPRLGLCGELQAHLHDERQAVKEKITSFVRLEPRCTCVLRQWNPIRGRYHSVAERLHKETPNSVWCNQYDNLQSSGPLRDRGRDLSKPAGTSHFCTGVGTGGTIGSTAQYLKEKNPDIRSGVWTHTALCSRSTTDREFDEKLLTHRGHREDILPANVDDIIDKFEKVTDKDGRTQELARMEGLFLSYSCGSAFRVCQLKDELKPTDVAVVLFHDHGSRYVGKVYNDDWMREQGWLA